MGKFSESEWIAAEFLKPKSWMEIYLIELGVPLQNVWKEFLDTIQTFYMKYTILTFAWNFYLILLNWLDLKILYQFCPLLIFCEKSENLQTMNF